MRVPAGFCRSSAFIRTAAALLALAAVALPARYLAADEVAGYLLSMDFGVTNNGDGTWSIDGQVDSDVVDPAGFLVTLGGLAQGCLAVVQDDGSFTYTISLPPHVRGMVTAQTGGYGTYAVATQYIFGN